MTDREAVDFLKKAVIYFGGRRTNRKQTTWELYIESMTKAINALEEKTMALPIPMSRTHGEWIDLSDGWQDGTFRCSSCQMEFVLLEGTPADNEYNFCPNCGADMRKKEGEKK